MKTNQKWTAVVRVLMMSLIAKVLGSPAVAPIVDWWESLGLPYDEVIVTNIVSLFFVGLVVLAVNWAGPYFAWVNKVISIGMSRTGPAYVPNDADKVELEANASGADTITKTDTPPPGPN